MFTLNTKLKEAVDFIVSTGQPLAYIEDNYMPYRFKSTQHTQDGIIYKYIQDIQNGKEVIIKVPNTIKTKIRDYNDLKMDIYSQIQVN